MALVVLASNVIASTKIQMEHSCEDCMFAVACSCSQLSCRVCLNSLKLRSRSLGFRRPVSRRKLGVSWPHPYSEWLLEELCLQCKRLQVWQDSSLPRLPDHVWSGLWWHILPPRQPRPPLRSLYPWQLWLWRTVQVRPDTLHDSPTNTCVLAGGWASGEESMQQMSLLQLLNLPK